MEKFRPSYVGIPILISARRGFSSSGFLLGVSGHVSRVDMTVLKYGFEGSACGGKDFRV